VKLLYLHGPPAAGKYTIAKALEAKIGARFFHNHLTIDAAKAIFDFGTPAFWDLVYALRLQCIAAAAQQAEGVVTYTSCYSHPHNLPFYEQIEDVVLAAGSDLLPVYLQCTMAELENQVANDSRGEMGKLQNVAGLHQALKQWHHIAVPRDECLTVVTAGKTAAECADEIILAFSLRH
jgi:adenylylsulfate kinase-like enzyme